MILMSGDTGISFSLCQPPFPTWRDLSDQLPNFAWAVSSLVVTFRSSGNGDGCPEPRIK